MGATADLPWLRRQSDQIIRLRLRQRATQKRLRASRIAALRLAGLGHEDARHRADLTIEQYRRARQWLNAAVAESLISDGLLTVDQALEQYAERHVESVIRVGLMKDRGATEPQIREQLGVSREQFQQAHEWWRDSTRGIERGEPQERDSP